MQISFPMEGELVKDANVRIKGTAENTDTVLVNGETADVVGDIWEVVIPFTQGNQKVEVSSGKASDEVNFFVDSFDPKLTVTEPERSTYYTKGTDGETVTVKGKVEEDNLDIVTINAQIIPLAADGSFEYQLKLKEGLNEILVGAVDKAGNKSEDVRAVMYGQWIDPVSDIEPGMNLFIRDSLIQKSEMIIKEVATPELVKSFAAEEFPDGFVLTSIVFDPLKTTIELKKGFIFTDFIITNLKLKGVYEEIEFEIEVDRIRATQEVIPFVTPDGGFDIKFENEFMELEEEDVRFVVGGFSSEDADFLRGLVVKIAKAGFGYLLSEAIFDELIDPDILIRKTELLGKELIFQLKLQELKIFTDGILIRTAFVLPAQAADVRQVPGALQREPGPASGGEPAGDILFTTSRYSFDRIAHGLWGSGLFHVELTKKEFADFELPFELNAAGLALALDSRLNNIVGPDAPVILRLRPQLPPVVALDEKSGKINIHMGEFLIDFVIVDGAKEIIVATMAAFFDLGINVSVNGFLVELSFDTTLRADLISEPEIDLDDQKTEKLFEDLIALIPKIFENDLELVGEADLDWVTLKNPDALIHGFDLDYVTFGMEVEPNLVAD